MGSLETREKFGSAVTGGTGVVSETVNKYQENYCDNLTFHFQRSSASTRHCTIKSKSPGDILVHPD